MCTCVHVLYTWEDVKRNGVRGYKLLYSITCVCVFVGKRREEGREGGREREGERGRGGKGGREGEGEKEREQTETTQPPIKEGAKGNLKSQYTITTQ